METDKDRQPTLATETTGRPQLREISNAIVALFKEAFGRGPINARARWVEDDTLLVTVQSSLTVAERHLVELGEHRQVRDARLFLSDVFEDQFRAIVEKELGRRTLAYVSGIDTTQDLTIQLFTLEPSGDGAGPTQ